MKRVAWGVRLLSVVSTLSAGCIQRLSPPSPVQAAEPPSADTPARSPAEQPGATTNEARRTPEAARDHCIERHQGLLSRNHSEQGNAGTSTDAGTVTAEADDAGTKAPVGVAGFPTANQTVGEAAAAPGPAGEKRRASGRLPPAVIQCIVRTRYREFRDCYERGLGRDPKLEGRVRVRFVIERDGTVSEIGEADSEFPDPQVLQCVRNGFRALIFPPPDGGIVTVVYPIRFSPG
jgi:hypothetical protein